MELIDKEKVLQICFETLPAFWYEVMEKKIEELETVTKCHQLKGE